MKHYIYTLLKDLPTVEAGHKIYIKENILEKVNSGIPWHFDDKCTYEILAAHKSNPEWVSVEYDMSKTVEVICPNCHSLGMFSCEGEVKYVYRGDGVSKWYENVGLECPKCEHKVYVASVCVDTKIQW